MSNPNVVTMLKTYIQKAMMELNEAASSVDFVVEIPKDATMGDYASNAAMQLTKVLKRNPKQIAQELVQHFDLQASGVERIEIAGPGFLNFFMDNQTLVAIIPHILEAQTHYGQVSFGKGKTYNVEFVSANPTGPLHLGHARQAAMGDSICRLLTACGFEVTREYYINDAGNQIHNLTMSVLARYHQLFDETHPMPEDGYFGQDIIEIAQKLKEEHHDKFYQKVKVNDELYWLVRRFAVALQLKRIQEDLSFYRVNFDVWSSESEIRDRGMVEKTLELLKELNVLYELEGATWFKTTEFGDDKDRVLVKSDQTYTYITPDIAYHIDKLARGYDYLVDILGADHHGYIKRLKAAIMACGHSEDTLSIEIVQMVRLIKDGEEFKMSKRSGNAVTLRELCEEVGLDATRYFFAARSASSHLDFDMDLATSKSNENPVFYAQYAHARMHSILEQAKLRLTNLPFSSYKDLKTNSEIALIKQLIEFPSVVEDAGKTLAPYKISNYIQKLAQLFHSFYAECKVIDEEQPILSLQRLDLVKVTQIVLANALTLIGVSAPTSM